MQRELYCGRGARAQIGRVLELGRGSPNHHVFRRSQARQRQGKASFITRAAQRSVPALSIPAASAFFEALVNS